jgi:hypothetical protein
MPSYEQIEGAAHALDSLIAILAVGDQLGHQRIVVGGMT